MAIFQPAYVLERVGADFTVSATVAGDVSAFALRAQFRDSGGNAGTVFATKTTGAGIVATYSAPNTTVVVTLNSADTATLTPGPYQWRLSRTDGGATFDLIDWSTVWLTPDDQTVGPQLVNLSDYVAQSQGFLTETVSDTDAKFYLPLIAAAEAAVRRLTGRNLSFGTYTEYFDAPIRGNLWTTETPIASITSIKFDATGGYGQLANTFGSDTLLDSTTDYYFRADRPDGLGYGGEIFARRLIGSGAWWPVGGFFPPGPYTPGLLGLRPVPVPGAFQVIYKAGYKLIPADLRTAICTLVSQMALRVPRGVPLQSEGGMNYNYSLSSFADEALRLDSVQSVIAGYRRGSSYSA